MKKIVASVGLVALGVSGLNTVRAQDVAPPPYKPWTVSATLRGFYDDNINTVPKTDPAYTKSFGFEVTPGLSLNYKNDQTMASVGYMYTLRWYDKRPLESERYDQDHNFNASLTHSFNERLQISMGDSFVIGQEPESLRPGAIYSEFQRVPGDNIRNYGYITLNDQLTPLLGLEAGYANEFLDYHASGAQLFTNPPPAFIGTPSAQGIIPGPSPSGTLDHTTHRIHLDSRWQLLPQTVGILGYEFDLTDYTGNEPVAIPIPFTGQALMSSDRNSMANKIYVGADQNFTPDLSASIRVGGAYYDYYNAPSQYGNKTSLAPYVHGMLKWTYAVESFVDFGLDYDRVPSDLVTTTTTDFTRDSDAATIFAEIKHRIVPKLFGDFQIQFQNSTYNGGSIDGKSQQYLTLGLSAMYQFNSYLNAFVGYDYDKLDSDIPGQAFDRNRVYIGATASY